MSWIIHFQAEAWKSLQNKECMKEAPGGNTNSLMSDMQQKEECVSFIEAGRKVQQNPRDAFSNAWEYLHCLNCKLYFNGLPRSAAQTLCQSILVQHLLKNNIRWVFLCYLAINNTESGPETWSVPELYKEKKKTQHYLLKTQIQLGAPSWIMILCVRFWWQQVDYGLWSSSIQFNWVLCLQHTELTKGRSWNNSTSINIEK